MQIVLGWIFFLVAIFCSPALQAGVYKCSSASGEIEFRDRACETNSVQEFLPYAYKTTPDSTKTQAGQSSEHFLLAQEGTGDQHEAKPNKKPRLTEEEKRLKKEGRLAKKAEKEAEKTRRRQERCLRTQEKIKNIEAELRKGCKIKKMNRLQKELAHCEKMKQRYCIAQ